ncbi:MAG: LacI family DNA-binding transcriptional regulator [Actinomycetota bacterium]|nr:LacI family DNA-binding transcriptional regulator [Actinomycetota bacterium]
MFPDHRSSEGETAAPDGSARRRPTVLDVAARSGVSAGTVSKVLNGRGQLREETRQRVMRAAQELDFRATPPTNGRRGQRSFAVGLLTTDSIGRFSIPVLMGAEEALGAGRISVLLADTRGDPFRERHYLEVMSERNIDGLIVMGRRCDPRPAIVPPRDIPTIYALAPSSDPEDISVVPDNAQGARLAIGHLIASGRTHIAHVTGPHDHLAARVRAEVTSAALSEAGLELAGSRINFGAWSEEWGRQAAHIVMRADEACDAISCGNDQIGRGAADALREMGYRVPEDVALVGFDNWDVMAASCRPPLTTIDMNLTELGRRSATLLLGAIDGQPARGTHELPCQLVVRESTGPQEPRPS